MLCIQNISDVVFDFDGVIIDSEKKKFSAIQDVAKKYGLSISDEQFSQFIGKKRGHFLKELGCTKEVISTIMFTIHKQDSSSFELIHGMRELLKFLQKKNISMHIATGSSRDFVKKQLEVHKIENYFSILLSGEDIAESKPSPQVYNIIKEMIGRPIVVIEDSPAGVQSAKSANVPVIGLQTYFQALDADVLCKDHKEVLELLQKQ